MNIVFLGPPGSGKGTLAEKATEILNVPQISTGAIFRTAIANKTELGLKVKAVIDAGQLVEDDITIALVKTRLKEADAQNGYILDGFPRTIAQAEGLVPISRLDIVINFDVGDSILLQRLGGRLTCRACGANYHTSFKKSKIANVCDICGGELYTRDDDQARAIQKRLDVYRAQTAPLIDYYRGRGILVDIDASLSPEAVVANFKKAIDRKTASII